MPSRFSSFNWDDLRFFLAVTRSGTLRGGADDIGANHATVSRRLAALEAGIDARLFDRTKNGLKLTQLGEELFPFALRVEDEIAAASRIVAGRDLDPSGRIYVSMPSAFSLTSVAEDIAQFSREYEQIELHLQVTDSFADLALREADVSIRFAYEVTDDVVGRRVLRCANAVYCAPKYAKKIKDDGGKGLTWIGWNEGEGETTAPWIKKSPFPYAQLRHRIADAVAQMSAAAAGMGLTYSKQDKLKLSMTTKSD